MLAISLHASPTASAAPAKPSTPDAPALTAPVSKAPVAFIEFPPIEPPAKATAQSVVQAQIADPPIQNATVSVPEDVGNETDEALAELSKDTARAKTIWGLLPVEPSQVPKLMSALSVATSTEAMDKIKRETTEAENVVELNSNPPR